MEQTHSKEGIQEIISTYKDDVQKLLRYSQWFEKASGTKASDAILPEGSGEHSMKVPVYDSTLLAFVKEAKTTKFMNRNYVYTYSNKRIKTPEDEHRVIDTTEIKDIKVLGDILSYYVLKGQTKGSVWSDGVANGVLYHVITRMKELIEFWTMPM